MASNSFKIKNSLVLTPKDLATLVSPEAGDLACDINDSNKIKRYDANSSSWVEVGSGGGVGGTDIFFVQDFESASLASFTQTGLTLSQTDPLHGKVSALLTHQAAVNQSFKQVIPVDRKFRGESMTLRLNCKSSASAGNVTIKIYDETNAANIVASEQLQLANDVSGAISQVGFTIPATCASISYTITALPQSGSPVTRIDDVIAELAVTSLLETVVELTGNAQTLTIPLTQSGLVQEADSAIRLDTANGFGSSGTVIRRFSNIRSSIGSDILYQDSATNGASFTAVTAGIYNISFTDTRNASGGWTGLSLNSPSLTTGIVSISDANRLASTYIPSDQPQSVSWTGYLNAGDIVRAHVENATTGAVGRTEFSMTKQGSLKQVSVSPDQKITIPTSELRFEGASSRGSTATAIVKFDTQAKLRGDAFTVESDSVLGTRITMKKAGKLNASASVSSSSASIVTITKNQGTPLTTIGTNSELIAADGIVAGTYASINCETDVAVGDVIRVALNATPTYGMLVLSFQEQDISVSVTNTLPQFSESDSSVRVDTANGYGSAGTKIRRFSSVRDSIGVDVEYLDNATNGASFTVKSAGVYDISYSDDANAATVVGLSKNAPDLTLALSSLASINRLAISDIYTANARTCVSWQGYLAVGDVIRAHTQGIPSSNAAFASFTMSKVGKPNVTGVNVTPFVNVPQPVSQSSFLNSLATFAGNTRISGALTSNTNNGIYSYDSSTGIYTMLKRAAVDINVSINANTAASSMAAIYINGSEVARSTGIATAGFYSSTSTSRILNVGESFYGFVTANSSNAQYVSVLATALSDQILTAPETFSTDTAPLTYANAATYTLSTLANAPVGTYITFTYAANTNTRTQTTLTNRPTQTDADMNANGMLIYTRAFNAPSTAGNPAAFAVQIGKGLKGVSRQLYKSVGKGVSGNLDYWTDTTVSSRGTLINSYNEVTGVLIVDAGAVANTTYTDSRFYFDDISTQTSGYLVINASKNPALTGMNIERVSARGVQSSGQSIPASTPTTITYDSAKSFDTNASLNNATGVFTAPEAGYYQVNGNILYASTSWTTGLVVDVSFVKNGVVVSTRRSIVAGTTNVGGGNSDIIYLKKNDILSMSTFHNNSGAVALISNNIWNQFSITKTNIGGRN